jgi:membrane protein
MKRKEFLSKIGELKSKAHKIAFLLKETVKGFFADDVIKLSAALSFWTIFSMPPLLIIIISLSGFFFGAEAVQGQIFGQIKGLVGNDSAMQIQDVIKNVKLSNNNLFTTGMGVFILLIGASGVFAEIQDSINFIWGIKAKPKRGIIKFLVNRLMSFSMIGSMGFLMLVGLILNALMDILNIRLAAFFAMDTINLFYVINLVTIFIVVTLLFTLIYKTLPDGKVTLKDCMIGASFTAFLFMLGKFAMGAYLGGSAIATWYGATGSVILIFLWVFYSAIILYFGAEFTKVYANTHGHKITPNSYSVKIEK